MVYSVIITCAQTCTYLGNRRTKMELSPNCCSRSVLSCESVVYRALWPSGTTCEDMRSKRSPRMYKLGQSSASNPFIMSLPPFSYELSKYPPPYTPTQLAPCHHVLLYNVIHTNTSCEELRHCTTTCSHQPKQ